MKIDPHPWDPEVYRNLNESDLDTFPDSTIRWKYITDENGNKKRVSNARIVKWSDGSMHLMVGNKTAYKIKIQKNRSFNYIYSDINNIPNLQAQVRVDKKMEMVPDSDYTIFQQQYIVRQN